MSPRKAHQRIDEHIVTAYRKKGERLNYGPYLCPICGTENLRILINENIKKVYVRCKCNFTYTLKYVPNNAAIDYYNKLIDNL